MAPMNRVEKHKNISHRRNFHEVNLKPTGIFKLYLKRFVEELKIIFSQKESGRELL
jgi:hypothetical protein